MNAADYQPRIVLLTTRFQYLDRRLLFTRARLFPDRVELSGWLPGAAHHTALPLAQLHHVEWRPGVFKEPNAVFHFQDGTEVPLHLNQVHRWQHLLEERLRWRSAYEHRPRRSRQSQDLRDLVDYVTSMS